MSAFTDPSSVPIHSPRIGTSFCTTGTTSTAIGAGAGGSLRPQAEPKSAPTIMINAGPWTSICLVTRPSESVGDGDAVEMNEPHLTGLDRINRHETETRGRLRSVPGGHRPAFSCKHGGLSVNANPRVGEVDRFERQSA